MAEQHEEALEHANRSLLYNPDFSAPHWVRACIFGWRGEGDAAKTALAELAQTDPFLCNARNFADQYQHVGNNAHAIEGLLRAGIPEH